MKQPSGKFVIRMSGTLHARLKEESLRSGQSLNQVCISRLQEGGYAAGASTAHTSNDLISPAFLNAVVRWWQEELAGLILFGSTARGEATSDSDIDLLLVMKPGVKIARHLYQLWEQFCDSCREPQNHAGISPHFAGLPGSAREAGGLWYEIAIEGMILWERDRQVARFLGSVREAMAQGKIRRRMLHGSPYWIKEF